VLSTVNETENGADSYGRLSGQAITTQENGWVSTTLICINSAADFDYLDTAATNITGQHQLSFNSSEAIVDSRLNYTLEQGRCLSG
jgi:hypothetical protein